MFPTMQMARIGKFLILSFALSAPAWASDRISASLVPNPVSENESIQFRIEIVTNRIPVFQPTFEAPDFTIVGQRDPLLNGHYEMEGGKPVFSKHVIYTYVLMAKKAGTFSIRNIKAKVADSTLRADAISVRVEADPEGPRRPSPPPAMGEDEDESTNPAAPSPEESVAGNSGMSAGNQANIFNYSDFNVVAFVNKTKAYVGEAIIAEYYLYDYGAVRACCEVQKWPTFNGFWKDDLQITTRYEFEDVYYKNRPMRRAFIGRYALYGIKPGKLLLDKMQIRAKYVSENSLGGNIFQVFDLRTGMHASQDVPVEILPLPEAGRPAGFGGAVGQFSVKLEADKHSLPQNTPVTLTLTFQGSGNFQAIESIKLALPPDFELYETTSSNRGATPIGVKRELESQKSFQVVAIPRKAGKFEIPPFRWSFFNPKKAAYETVSTEPVSLEVTQNTSGAENTNSYIAPASPTESPKAGTDLRYLKPHTASNFPWARWLAVALVAVNALLLARLLKRKTSSLGSLYKTIDPFAEARSGLLAAKRMPGSQWQSAVEEAVFSVVQVLLGLNPRGMTKNELEDNWKSRNLPFPLFQRTQAVLEELDRSRFSSTKQSPEGGNFRERMLAEAETIVKEAGRARKKNG